LRVGKEIQALLRQDNTALVVVVASNCGTSVSMIEKYYSDARPKEFAYRLAPVVGRLDVAARQEHQQLVARRHGDGRPQVAALDIGRLEVQQAIQLAVEAVPMGCDRAVGEIGPPVPDRAGITP
jgi:hypothetical protein